MAKMEEKLNVEAKLVSYGSRKNLVTIEVLETVPNVKGESYLSFIHLPVLPQDPVPIKLKTRMCTIEKL